MSFPYIKSLDSLIQINQELEYWKQLVFAFYMDNRRPPNSGQPSSNAQPPITLNGGNISRSLLQQDTNLLPQHPATPIGQHHHQPNHQPNDNQLLQSSYPPMTSHPNFYTNVMQAPGPPMGYPWNLAPTQQPPHPSQAGPNHYPPSFLNTSGLPFTLSSLNATQASMQLPPLQPSTVGSSTATGSLAIPQHVEQAIAEEKRRRNTAASARFRIKKKHKTIALERSVSDLIGRTEELEREVADLRQENAWLKEIVMLKGIQHAANYQEALRRTAATMVSGSPVVFDALSGGSSSPRDSFTDEVGDEEGEDDTEEDEEPSENKSTKGKGPAKGPRII